MGAYHAQPQSRTRSGRHIYCRHCTYYNMQPYVFICGRANRLTHKIFGFSVLFQS